MVKPLDSYIGIRILQKLRTRMERIARRRHRGNLTAAVREAMEEYVDRQEADMRKRRAAK